MTAAFSKLSRSSPGQLGSSSSKRCRTHRRVLILLFIILLIASGSLIVLHVTTTHLASQSHDPYASFSSSSSSSIARWTAGKFSHHRQWDDIPLVDDHSEQDSDESSKHQTFGRPRIALPHHNIFNDEREQALMKQQLEIQQLEISHQQVVELQDELLAHHGQGQSQESIQRPPSPTTVATTLADLASPESDNRDQDIQSPIQLIGQNVNFRESAMNPRPFEETLISRHSNGATRYLTYLPYAGITNQFYGLLRGLEVAKALDRTLIIPPITSSSHDKSKQNQPWSKFLDLEQFSHKTGVKVVELHEIRDAELTQYNELQCRITCGFGSKRTIDFTAKGFLRQWRLNATLGPLPVDDGKLETILSTLEPFEKDKYICISNTYKIAVKDKSEWERFGQHLRFTPELENFVQRFLDTNLSPMTTTDPIPENKRAGLGQHRFLAIHARRGDFVKYCQGNFAGPKMVHCLPSTDQIAERINLVQGRLNPTNDPKRMLPVFVATNERNPEELKRFMNLGWRYLDHEKMGTVEALGIFGPMMVDQVFMAYAETLVGIQMSTFSRVGALRQRDWQGRQVEYM
ncbi:hypothetical protein EDD11_002052 [Mortierella claussenii]|nr:hypothetical protein EDD11_002052 [Mortierella claussenii]